MSIRTALLAATVVALPLGAQAQPVTGFYVAAGAGVNWMGNTSSNFSTPLDGAFGFPAGSNIQYGEIAARFNTGWAAVGSLGWGFGNGLRAEGELSYRYNSISRLRANGIPTVVVPGEGSFNTCDSCATSQGSSSGSVSNTAVMANLFYEFNFRWIQPYLGAGIGVTWVNWSNVVGNTTVSDSFGSYGLRYRANGTQTQFAYQFIGGFAIPIQAVPGLAITAEYRYFASLNPTISATASAISTDFESGRLGVGRLTFNNTNQTALVGVRYNFGQRAAAPAPLAVAPAPARSFLVFFDFASDQLTARAREIVGQAAQAARSQQVTRIEVAGHTDTVGSAQYNQGLSIRRANNVAAELVRQGVPRQAITTAGFGFSRPLVPTGPNVREPQNRRVEIVLR